MITNRYLSNVLLSAALFVATSCGPGAGSENGRPHEPEVASTDLATVEWANNSTIYEVNIRQYTVEGTFEAFQPHLSRLDTMGVELLWFMPIYPISEVNRKGLLGSYYAIADYTAVNPAFGTLDEFKAILESADDDL